MEKSHYNLILADDDYDDCMFFKEALDELNISTILHTVNDGVELMYMLTTLNILPDALFLDLNMPRKTGFECLSEIKANHKLSPLPIFILSTSLDIRVVDSLFEKGAHYYIRKPGDFVRLKNVIHQAIDLLGHFNNYQPAREKFILHS